MADPIGYRVLGKREAALALAVLVGLCALAVWGFGRWLDAYSVRVSDLMSSSPRAAAALLSRDLRVLAAVNGILAWAAGGIVVWQGWRGMRARVLPPPGSWIIEGQRIRSGPKAIAVSRLLVLLGGAVGLIGTAASVILWLLSLRMSDLLGVA